MSETATMVCPQCRGATGHLARNQWWKCWRCNGRGFVITAALAPVVPAQPSTEEGCHCPPCPGRGNDGHGLTHCAECCFGSGVEADEDCPVHGRAPAPVGSDEGSDQ